MSRTAAGSTAPAAVRALRSARQRKHFVSLEWFEVAYKVYIAAIVVITGVVLLSHAVGDRVLTAAQRSDVIRYAPAGIGLVVAIVIGAGLRSGARGGPLAVEAADVHYLLLAPVARRTVLLRPAVQRLRFGVFIGASLGALAGELLGRRWSGALSGWIVAGAAVGATIGLVGPSVALGAHELRLPSWVASLMAAGLIGWQSWALWRVDHLSGPFDTVGSLALWPLRVHAVDLIGPAVAAALAVISVIPLERLSIEALTRRSSLVKQLRFAVTMRDLRTVVLLRRQLANEQHRKRPWFGVPGGLREPVIRRGARSIARFPAVRLLRMFVLAIVAALAQVAAFRGTTPAVLVSGLATFVLGLECLEPFAQEIDQPDRCETLPHSRGWLLARHLVVPAVVALLFGVLGGAVALATTRTSTALQLCLVLVVPVVWSGLAGAVLDVMSALPDPITPGSVDDLLPPEVAGFREMMRTVRPLAVAIIGSLPVLAARSATRHGNQPIPPALQVGVAVALVLAAVVWWARKRDEFKAKARALWAAGDAEFNARRSMKYGGDR